VTILGGLGLVAACAVAVGLMADRSVTPSVTELGPTTRASPAGPVTIDSASVAPAPDITTTTATAATATATTATATTTTTGATTTSALAPPDGKSSADRRLVDSFTVTDADLQPKSVVASGDGLFFAQNMMYRHNVSVFDRSGAKVASISDQVDLAAFGVDGGVVAQGAPVEAAFSPDGSAAYVSNYKMYGPGFDPSASDDCNRGSWDDSYVYRIDTASFEIDAVIPTGAVPKFLAVSPDGRRLVVSNWCGFDVSIIDTATASEITRVDVGRHPRGVAITSDSRSAYVTVMGEAKIVVIDLRSNAVVNTVPDAGATPRHLVLSPDDRYLYVTSNREGVVRKIDLRGGGEVGRASTGTQPRSMAIADDGESLYVVNYRDGTVSKVRTSDMAIVQTEYSGVHPVGITYDSPTRQVWVANYAGTLRVFTDT
jgi:YVTN family beta-propeller protein